MQSNSNTGSQWFITNGERTLIAGPCSAESETQMMDTAKQIAALYPNAIFRAGVWKPRTRPGMFEGKGEGALEWLAQVKRETGLRVATEVAVPRQVEQSLKAGIDMLWVGARTTVNPFMVQELADAVRGVDVPVLVKNPLHPDLQLWIGAMERFTKVGITKLAAIHRGFYTFEQSEYRNSPRWELVFELQSEFPDLPIICDISHIAGSRALLQMVAQQAVDLKLDALMIETHCDPTKALSDAQQQVTPTRLKELLDSLHFRNPEFTAEIAKQRMAVIRTKIDEIDQKLLSDLSARMVLAKEIAELKKEHNISILQLQRWKDVIERSMHKADEVGLYREFVRNIFIQIHDESIRIQSSLLTEPEKAEKV